MQQIVTIIHIEGNDLVEGKIKTTRKRGRNTMAKSMSANGMDSSLHE